MKKYKLKRWYPGLPEEWKDRDVIVEKADLNEYYLRQTPPYRTFEIELIENNPNFWEEIKPTYITEDGVKLFEQDVVWFVHLDSFEIGKNKAYIFENLLDFYKLFSTKKAAKKWVRKLLHEWVWKHGMAENKLKLLIELKDKEKLIDELNDLVEERKIADNEREEDKPHYAIAVLENKIIKINNDILKWSDSVHANGIIPGLQQKKNQLINAINKLK